MKRATGANYAIGRFRASRINARLAAVAEISFRISPSCFAHANIGLIEISRISLDDSRLSTRYVERNREKETKSLLLRGIKGSLRESRNS